MLYALNRNELQQLRSANWTAEFTGAEMLSAVFRTDPGVLGQILPRPLRPPPNPLALAFVAHYPQTNFGTVYNEAALFVQAEYRGRLGMYCLSMPVDDDMAMAGGREVFGYPKKMAESISLEKQGSKVIGSAVRKGTEILRIEVEPKTTEGFEKLAMTGVPDPAGERSFEVTAYMFKHFMAPSMRGFDYLPRLVAEPIVLRPRPEVLFGDGMVTLTSSPYDPLGEVPVVEMITCAYGLYDNIMLPGKVVGRVWNPFAFAKHAFFKVDVAAMKLGDVGDSNDA
ncbi:MAG: acetoacetate decarboxylase family protein [Pseudomonadota bacterium]|nr:acetoacetate decarboxylase family protein [Pseudomonadota bacterium]